jgi:hypothetical protein
MLFVQPRQRDPEFALAYSDETLQGLDGETSIPAVRRGHQGEKFEFGVAPFFNATLNLIIKDVGKPTSLG